MQISPVRNAVRKHVLYVRLTFHRHDAWVIRPLRIVRAAPVTTTYLLVLAATSTAFSLTSTRSRDRLLFDLSTNLHQLARVPVRVLVASAFWLGGWSQLLLWAVLLLAVLAPVERRLGSRRTLIAFAIGHIGATLVVAAGLLVALRLGAVDPLVERARDVGASYGFLAVAALATYLLPRALRLPYAVLLSGCILFLVATSGSFTDFGHLTAVAIGLACYPLARRPPSPRLDAHPARAETVGACGSPMS